MTAPPEVETCDFVPEVETYDLRAGEGEDITGGEELVAASEAELVEWVELGAGGV